MKEKLVHIPVLLEEIIESLPSQEQGHYLDLTAGGGGHFSALLDRKKLWRGTCWDRDPRAEQRVKEQMSEKCPGRSYVFFERTFSQEDPEKNNRYSFILADLGVSAFQLEDPSSGMSLWSDEAVELRMNPAQGLSFSDWLEGQSVSSIKEILEDYAEEKRAEKLAHALKSWPGSDFQSAKLFAQKIAETLAYKTPSRKHPATRIFQALRMAINEEYQELSSMLKWAPLSLELGGRMAVISFHSIEDRLVKRAFKKLTLQGSFKLLYKGVKLASDFEQNSNSRSKSAKLRVIERIS